MKSAVPARHNPRNKAAATKAPGRRPAVNRQHAAATLTDKRTEDFIAAVMGLKLKLK